MPQEPRPTREAAMTAGQPRTTAWDTARDRLANPEHQRTSWLATVRPEGGAHLMPVIAFWIEGALHFVAGEGTQKGRNLAADDRCVIGTTSTTLPSIDLVVEGRAEPLDDEASVQRVAAELRSNNWPLDVEGTRVRGPHAPTAGPPPYRIYRLVPSKAFGLPGMHGMDQVEQDELPKPTRWEFSGPVG